MLCVDIHQIGLRMEGVVVVYYDGDMVPSSEGVLFGCLNGPKFVKISEEMLLDFMRKAITNRGGKWFGILHVELLQ